jgi:hypothetical protein
MSAWTCSDCAGFSTADLIRAGAYTPPTDPDTKCSGCGTPLSAGMRTMLLLEKLARQGGPVARPAETTAPKRRNTTAGILSARATAARLGVNRSTLSRLVQAEILVSVPKGGRRGYRTADVEALIERGFSLDSPAPVPPPKTRTRRRSRKNGTADPSIEDRLARF